MPANLNVLVRTGSGSRNPTLWCFSGTSLPCIWMYSEALYFSCKGVALRAQVFGMNHFIVQIDNLDIRASRDIKTPSSVRLIEFHIHDTWKLRGGRRPKLDSTWNLNNYLWLPEQLYSHSTLLLPYFTFDLTMRYQINGTSKKFNESDNSIYSSKKCASN